MHNTEEKFLRSMAVWKCTTVKESVERPIKVVLITTVLQPKLLEKSQWLFAPCHSDKPDPRENLDKSLWFFGGFHVQNTAKQTFSTIVLCDFN